MHSPQKLFAHIIISLIKALIVSILVLNLQFLYNYIFLIKIKKKLNELNQTLSRTL